MYLGIHLLVGIARPTFLKWEQKWGNNMLQCIKSYRSYCGQNSHTDVMLNGRKNHIVHTHIVKAFLTWSKPPDNIYVLHCHSQEVHNIAPRFSVHIRTSEPYEPLWAVEPWPYRIYLNHQILYYMVSCFCAATYKKCTRLDRGSMFKHLEDPKVLNIIFEKLLRSGGRGSPTSQTL